MKWPLSWHPLSTVAIVVDSGYPHLAGRKLLANSDGLLDEINELVDIQNEQTNGHAGHQHDCFQASAWPEWHFWPDKHGEWLAEYLATGTPPPSDNGWEPNSGSTRAATLKSRLYRRQEAPPGPRRLSALRHRNITTTGVKATRFTALSYNTQPAFRARWRCKGIGYRSISLASWLCKLGPILRLHISEIERNAYPLRKRRGGFINGVESC